MLLFQTSQIICNGLEILTPPVGSLRRRAALVDDEETRLQMRKAIENTALSVTGVLKVKRKARLFSEEIESKEDVKAFPEKDDCKILSFPYISDNLIK